MKRVQKRLKNVEEIADGLTMQHTYRRANYFALNCQEGGQNQGGGLVGKMNLNSCTEIEVALSKLRWFNPVLPDTFTQVDYTDGDLSRRVRILRSSIKFKVRANLNTDVNLEIWECTPVVDTNNSADIAWAACLADQSYDDTALAVTTTANTLSYPSDLPVLAKYWKFKSIRKGLLKVGQEWSYTMANNEPISYDINLYDNHTSDFIKQYKPKCLVYRLHGVLSHDAITASLVTLCGAGIDCSQEKTYVLEYNGGMDSQFLETDEQMDNMSGVLTGSSGYPSVPTHSTYAI